MVRSDNDLELHCIHFSKHIFSSLGPHIFKIKADHPISRISNHVGISSFVENSTTVAKLYKQGNLQCPHTKAMKHLPLKFVHPETTFQFP